MSIGRFLFLLTAVLLLYILSSLDGIVVQCCYNNEFIDVSNSGLNQQSSQISIIDFFDVNIPSNRKKLMEGTVIGVNEYFAIYLWKDKMMNLYNLQHSPQTLEELVQIIRNSNKTISLSITSTFKSYINTYGHLFGFESISQQVKYTDLTPFADCIFSDNMIVSDGFIGTASSISATMKAHKMIYPESKQDLELRNFYSIRYIPKSLVISSLPMESDSNVQFLSNIIETNMNYLNVSYQCGTGQVLTRDAAWARYGFSFVNFTISDIRAISGIYNISINYDPSYVNNVIEKYSSYLYFNESMSSVLQHMSDTSCMQCPYALCYTLISQDYASYIAVGIALLYFVLLFSLGLFRSYSLKRRLFLPYLPLFGIIRNLANTQMFSVTCSSVSRPMALFASVVIIAVYFFTILRYVYMRNMYNFLSKSNKSTRFHKRFLSIPFALFMSCVFILIFSIIIVLPTTAAFEIYSQDNYIVNGVGVAVIFISILASVTFLGVDLFLNRKNIKRFGLTKFLLFDDPMYLRIDITFQTLILLFTILYMSVSFVDIIFPAIIDVFISISIILICGGNAMTIELSKKIIYKNRNNEEQTQLESLMENNKEFYMLMSEYATKEFSYENIAFYDAILDCKNRKSLSLDDLKRIESEFVHPFSKYEVNLPSQVKKDLTTLIQDLSIPSQSDDSTKLKIMKQQLIEAMFLELCKNLTDTFHRLKQTQQYSKWLEVYQLQKENSLNV